MFQQDFAIGKSREVLVFLQSCTLLYNYCITRVFDAAVGIRWHHRQERCMEINLPWALIDAAQRRWVNEKMNMGQDTVRLGFFRTEWTKTRRLFRDV